MRPLLTILVFAVLLSISGRVLATTLYVDLNCPTPTLPYTNWSIAATNIQDAVDAAQAGDVVLVTNGLYRTGGRAVSGLLTNRVAVTKGLALRSVNGAQVTTIQGYQVPNSIYGDAAVRCIYLTNGAMLVGFTLTNGATQALGCLDGGGAYCEGTAIISNSVIVGNAAKGQGGGVANGVLVNCIVTSNNASSGGGVANAILYFCH